MTDAIDINGCGAPILCECEECGTKFWDTDGHTPDDCLEAQRCSEEFEQWLTAQPLGWESP